MNMARVLRCNVLKLLVMYLGLPLEANPRKVSMWKSVNEKIEKILSMWKALEWKLDY